MKLNGRSMILSLRSIGVKLVTHSLNEWLDHEVIPFGKGICGQVAISNDNFLVDDVSAQDNYIACDIHVKSEIVIPLFSKGVNIGQIDIDSKKINAFTEKDAKFLEQLNTAIAEKLF